MHTAAACALVLAATVFACTDARELTTGPVLDHPFRLSLTPRFHAFGSSSQLAPINLARLTVLSAATRNPLGPTTVITLDPSSSEWRLPVDFTLPDNSTQESIVVVVELLNLTDGVQTIEWSGQTAPISVTAGQNTPSTAPIEVFRGPLDNLNVLSITVAPLTTRLIEGDSAQLHAATIGTGTPQLFWTSLDPSIAVISNNGVLRGIVAGSARVVASAASRSDTLRVTIAQRAASVAATPAPLSFSSVGQQLTLSGRVLDPRGTAIIGDSVAYIIADPSIIDQPTPGTFRALRAGSTSVTALAVSTPTVRTSVPVNVVPVAATVALSQNVIDLRTIGETQRVTATASDAGGNSISGAVFQWRSENPAIADVAPDGTVTARGTGSTGIVATSQSASARLVVNVNPNITSTTVTPATVLLESIGATAALAAVGRDAGSTVIPLIAFTWLSSAPNIVSVDANGLITAVAAGTARITARAPGGATGGSDITVRQRVAAIVPSPATVTLESIGVSTRITLEARDATGHPAPLSTTTFVWSTDAPAVATVDQTGLITAVGNGSASITVRAATGATAVVPVTVRQHAQTISLTPASRILRNPNDTVRLVISGADANGNPVVGGAFTWSSSDPLIASVDATGLVTAHASGTAVVSAADRTVSGSSSISVQFAITSVSITPGQVTFASRNDSTALTATAFDALNHAVDGTRFTWVSVNPAVFTIDANTGVARAVGNGVADVIAFAPNGVSGRIQIVVQRQVANLTISPDTLTLPRGQQRQFVATTTDANGFAITGNAVAWSSSNTAVATVSSAGIVTAVADSGSARITASSAGVVTSALVRAIRGAAPSSGRILIYAADAADDVKANIVATGIYSSSQIDILSMQYSNLAPLSTLTQYSCVLTFTNYPPAPDGIQVGDRLKEYVDVGGRVVLMTYSFSLNWRIAGGIMTPGYSPFVLTNSYQYQFPRSLNFSTALTSHALLSGVTDFSYYGNSNYADVIMSTGSTLVASDNYGIPLIGINATGSVVGINLFPRTDYFSHSAGVDRVIANACR